MAAQNKTSDISEKILEFSERIFNSLWDSDNPQDVWHWLILLSVVILVIGIVLIVSLKTFKGVIEQLAKFIEIYKASGLPVWLNKINKVKVRRRKQFCAVLDADLAYLAKAENWNDQYFTDLEAEVETEGGYYATALDKLRRKKSFGLRKERSLIRAITTSTERAMQLVGEPGSGKSVALRHLAKQFAEQGRKSNDKNATVPLYINLREMEFSNIDEVNADSVREFVLENIRRGDADTSAFVKENWDDYCNRGIWLFLFDSFDEIPAVLHSAAGSNIIRHYSQALRHFLEGMGECKGILASREFKGPEALPWKKLRILPLSGEKQDELIRNSFLDVPNMNLVRQHLANSHNSIGATPLFLTLLCRYVRDEKKAPSNDHNILLQHIERLARREPDYLERKYKLSPEELMIGAERLARLFAENDTLSLAPSLDQIISQITVAEIPGGSIERLISALVDSKIGRADVPNAAQGDRRFAFAHRRYQEALFVRYLTVHSEILSARELLTEARWREYAVTLLQTRDFIEISNLLREASLILKERAESQNYNICGESPLPTDLVYFDWSSETAIPLLSLLQEGLTHRPKDVPDYLSYAVSDFLKPRWEKGDSWDRCEVLRLGGLLPQDTLVGYLVETFDHGTKAEQLNAFRQSAFVSELPEEAQNVVLRMLSDQVIIAKNRADQLTIEALAARLPSNMGASIVVNRGKKLRRNLEWVRKIVPNFIINYPLSNIIGVQAYLFGLMDFQTSISLREIQENKYNTNIGFDLSFIFSILFSSWFVLGISLIKEPLNFSVCLFILISIVMLCLCIMFSPFLVRYRGKKINIFDISSWFLKLFFSKVFWRGFLIMNLLGVVFLSLNAFLGYILVWASKKYIHVELLDSVNKNLAIYTFLGFIFTMIIANAFFIIKILFDGRNVRRRKKESINKLNETKKLGLSDMSILYSAENYEELVFWVQYDNNLLSNTHSIRTFSSFIQRILRLKKYDKEHALKVTPTCLKNKKPTSSSRVNKITSYFVILRQTLEERITNDLK